MTVTIYRIQKDKNNPYVMLDKRLLEDSSISWKAKGILCYLLSKPDNWMVRVADLVNQSPEGKASVRAAIDELIAAGYIKRFQSHAENGRFAQSIYEVYEVPHTEKPYTENRETVSPCTDYPYTENRTLNNNDLTNIIKVVNEPQILKIPTEQQAEQLWQSITGMVVIPSGKRGDVLEAIISMLNNYGEVETENRLRAAWVGWTQKKTKTGQPYSRTNTAWVDYAVAGEIPQEYKAQDSRKNGNGKSTPTRQLPPGADENDITDLENIRLNEHLGWYDLTENYERLAQKGITRDHVAAYCKS